MTKEERLTKTVVTSIACGTLAEGDDAFLLCVISKRFKVFIPCLRQNGIGFAYIDPTQCDNAHYTGVAALVNDLVKQKIFTHLRYTPTYQAAPVYNRTITGFVKPTGISYALPNGIKDTLVTEGFILGLNTGNKSPYQRRDYGTQIEDNPDFKFQYEVEVNKLKEANVSFDNLPLGVRLKYEDIINGSLDGVILLGPTGTGKTWISMAMACQAKAHREDIQISAGTQEEDLEGKYIVDDRPDAKAPYRFVEGPLLRAYSVIGCAVTIQEVGNASPGIAACLNKYLDGTSQVTVNGKVYHRHPNFFAVLTSNPGYRGTEELNESLKGRFSIIQVDKWTEEQYIKVLSDHSSRWGHVFPVNFYKELIKLAIMIEQTGTSNSWREKFEFSIRNALRFLNSILLKPRSFEEFSEVFYDDYLNLLSCDNNNSEKLVQYKNDQTVISNIKSLYQYYDYSEIEENKELEDDLDYLFEDEDEDEDGIDPSIRKTSLDKAAERFKKKHEEK